MFKVKTLMRFHLDSCVASLMLNFDSFLSKKHFNHDDNLCMMHLMCSIRCYQCPNVLSINKYVIICVIL